MKKLLAFALTAILALGVVTPVLAANGEYPENGYENGYEENGYDNGYENGNGYEALPALLPVGRVGEITEYYEGRLTVQLGEDDYIILNIQDSTVIIDAETGLPASIEDRAGDSVKIYHSPVTTMSLPPQSNALVIALDLPEYTFAPNLHIIEEIYTTEEGTLRLTVDNGGLYLFLDDEVELFPHLTRQFVLPETLQVGDTLLFWYNIVAMSFPGQAHPSRALWISAADVEGDIEENGYENGYIAVYPLTFADVINQYEIAPWFAPGSDVALFLVYDVLSTNEALTISWDEATRSAVVTGENLNVILPLGASHFYLNGIEISLPVPLTVNAAERMVAPIDVFRLIAA